MPLPMPNSVETGDYNSVDFRVLYTPLC